MMRPSARYAVAYRPSTDTERSMMRLIADFVMTTSLSAAYSQTGWPLRTTLAARSIRSSIVIRPARHASRAGSSSSSVVAGRNPSPPRFTPRSGTPRSPTALAIERRVPSPPRTISRSTCDGSSALPAAAGTSDARSAVSFSSTAPSPCAESQESSSAMTPLARARPASRRSRLWSRKGLDAPADHRLQVTGSPAVRREVQEELVIAFRASQRGSSDTKHMPASQHSITRQPLDRSPMLGGLANDAALGDVLATDLELRLHERDDLAARGEHAEHRGQDFLERDEGHVDDRQRRLIAEDPRIERASVRVLHHDDSLILAQARVELARADVDRVDPCGAALEQTISESARGRADVHADAPGDLDREGAQGVHELLAAAAHERAARSDLDLGPRRYQDARLIH